jgi:hypothetical protein
MSLLEKYIRLPLTTKEPIIRTAVSPGVYVDGRGAYWSRPSIKGRRTWRKLRAIKQREAIKENANTEYAALAGNVADLAQLYCDANCPNRCLEARSAKFCAGENSRLVFILKYFGLASIVWTVDV